MKLPDFTLPASDGQTYSTAELSQGRVILYTYPKDSTPGCTLEANDFQRLLPEFLAANVRVFGLSKDTIRSHEKFCTNQSLTFPLLSDTDKTLIEALGCIKEKSMFGKKYMGVTRDTLLFIDGDLVHEWRGVKAKGHAQQVLEYTQKNTRY